MLSQGRRKLLKTGWARPQIILSTLLPKSLTYSLGYMSTFFFHKLNTHYNFLLKTGWANAHPLPPPLHTITPYQQISTDY